VRAGIAALARERHGVTLDVHGCTPRHVARQRTFDPQLNAAVRSGILSQGDADSLRPCPPLGKLAVVDVCASARVLLRERWSRTLVRDAWRSLLLAQALLVDPPAWEGHYTALRADPPLRRVLKHSWALLRELEAYQRRLPETPEELQLLVARRG